MRTCRSRTFVDLLPVSCQPVDVAVSTSPASSAARAMADSGARRTLDGNTAGVPQAVRGGTRVGNGVIVGVGVAVGVAVGIGSNVAVGVASGANVSPGKGIDGAEEAGGNGIDGAEEAGGNVYGSFGPDWLAAVGVAITMTGT